MSLELASAYLGIDLSDKYAMISYFQKNMNEPDTISPIMGSEVYAIPLCLAKRKGIGQWFFGQEAKNQAKNDEAILVEDILNKALSKEPIYLDGIAYEPRDLLVIYMKKLLAMTNQPSPSMPLGKIIITVDSVSAELQDLFMELCDRLEIAPYKLQIIDHTESFYYYALNQEEILFSHDVLLFDYSGLELKSCYLSKNTHTKPQMVSLNRINHGALLENKDIQFNQIVNSLLNGKVISSVYLIGDGFDGDWMKISLQSLCKGRRVFAGKNLYSKGACFGGMIKGEEVDWPFIYMGDSELKANVSLKVSDNNDMKFVTLLNAGESWYDAKGECEVILDGTNEIECWLQRPERRDARIEVVQFPDMPQRENRMTRLRIEAKPISDTVVELTVIDLGFGELAPSSGKQWKHTLEGSWES